MLSSDTVASVVKGLPVGTATVLSYTNYGLPDLLLILTIFYTLVQIALGVHKLVLRFQGYRGESDE
jgi:hypothetical protein